VWHNQPFQRLRSCCLGTDIGPMGGVEIVRSGDGGRGMGGVLGEGCDNVPKHIGAALCYRTICVEGAALLGRHARPEVTMHTYPLSDYMRHIDAGRWAEVSSMLLDSAEKLRRTGANLLICPDNTAHQAIDLVREQSPLPWLHIAEEIAKVAGERHFHRLLILGTKYLMEGPVYPTKLRSRGIEYDIPPPDERKQINILLIGDADSPRPTLDQLGSWHELPCGRPCVRKRPTHGSSGRADARRSPDR